MLTVQPGDLVRVRLTGRLEGGEVFAVPDGREPVAFIAGGDDVFPGLAEAVVGMAEGERKTVTVPPWKGFGERDPTLEFVVPRSELPPDVHGGEHLTYTGPDGPQQVWVSRLDEDSALLDGNHPLAGQTLTLEIELVSVEPAGPAESD